MIGSRKSTSRRWIFVKKEREAVYLWKKIIFKICSSKAGKIVIFGRQTNTILLQQVKKLIKFRIINHWCTNMSKAIAIIIISKIKSKLNSCNVLIAMITMINIMTINNMNQCLIISSSHTLAIKSYLYIEKMIMNSISSL